MVQHHKPTRDRQGERRKRAEKYRQAVARGAYLRMGHLLACKVFDESRSEHCNCGKWEADREA